MPTEKRRWLVVVTQAREYEVRADTPEQAEALVWAGCGGEPTVHPSAARVIELEPEDAPASEPNAS